MRSMGKRNSERETTENVRVRRLWHVSAVVVALIMTLCAGLNLFYHISRQTEDGIYQRGSNPNESIVVIGLDAYAMQELGSWPWDRAVIAEVLETLNQDEEKRPAAIGLDIVFSGETNEESDERLAKAAAEGNVVVAGMVEFSNGLAFGSDGEVYLDNYVTANPSLPYKALQSVAQVGHINAMYDRDGVLRRHLFSVRTPDGSTMMSMPWYLYKLYNEYYGTEADFIPKTDKRGFWWIDYDGKPGDYYYCSVADILNGTYDADLLEGAIVLIGPYDAALADDFTTAVDHATRMYGAEYMANVTSCLLRQDEKREVDRGVQLFLLFLLCVLTVEVVHLLKIGWNFLCLLASELMLLVMSVGLYRAGYVIHFFWYFIGIIVSFSVCIIGRYVMAVSEKRRVAKTFGRYVDPKIIKELLDGDKEALELKGKTKNIAVLFVDIRGFTTMSEQLTPEHVVDILNEYLTLTSSCVKRYRGTLDKFIGDCTMAFWGAPLSCEDPVYQACQAAVDMVKGADALQDKLQKKFGKTVNFGIGVHYGPAVVGNIGSPERMDYTAIGDTVNTSSRLEANAPAGTIYISRIVADILGDRAVIEPLDHRLALKGKAEGFEVLILKGLKEGQEDGKGKEESIC